VGRGSAAFKAGGRLSIEQALAYALQARWTDPVVENSAEALLTPRERQVAALVAQGLTNAQIGRRLNLAERTVVSHLEHIRTKVDVPSRTQLAVWAAGEQLVAD
jgi:non-specific serine/threonine protein kinase